MTFISRVFYFLIISEFLNLRVSVHVFYNVYSDSLLARHYPTKLVMFSFHVSKGQAFHWLIPWQ